MKIYQVTFITKENRTAYVHVADVEATNAKEAKNIVAERHYSKRTAHAFDIKAKKVDAITYESIHRLTDYEDEALAIKHSIKVCKECIAEYENENNDRKTYWEERLEEKKAKLEALKKEAQMINRLDEVERGLAIER